jgi:hypothetical protein
MSEQYKIAYKCCETKASNRCGTTCDHCAFNLCNYMDSKQAHIIHVNAAIDYQAHVIEEQQTKNHATTKAIIIGTLIGVIILLILCL